MANAQASEKAPGSRVVYLVALLAAAVDSAAAFGRVFRGSEPAFRLAVAAGVAVLLAAALERRHVLLATLVSGVGLAFAIGLLLFPKTLWHGLPTATTLRSAGQAWSRIGDLASTEVAPARPLAPLFLAGLTAVWAAAFSAHALAVRARSPFLALLPPAALLAFPSILLTEGARPLYVLFFLLAALALLFADALRRVGQWGPVTMWQGRRHRLSTMTSLRGARWLGVWSVGLAIVIPGILPGYHRPGLIDVHDAGLGSHVAIDPLVNIKPQLLRTEPIPLFTVTASEPAYWRFAALDTFDGQVWDSKNLDVSTGVDVRSGPLAPDPRPDPTAASFRLLTQHYEFQLLAQTFLPAAYNPVQIASGRSLRYDPRASVLVDPDGTRTGFTYDVRSAIVTPTKDLLNQVQSLKSDQARPYLALPRIPDSIRALAHQLTDDKPTPYEKVRAIQNYFRDQFRYDVNAPAGHSVNHMEYFLFTSKAGYCEQFAGTMAVMLRAIGIPARVAVGFTTGRLTPDRKYQVTTDNAHAWVEVLFPSYGWLGFEPTPTRRNPTTAAFDFPVTIPPQPQGGATCPTLSEHGGPGGHVVGDPCERGRSGQQVAPPGGRRGEEPPPGPSEREGGGEAPQPVSWKVRALEAALVAALLVLGAIPVIKAVRRRRTIKRARAGRDRVLAAYGILTEQAGDAGLGRSPAETLWEYRTRLRERIPELDARFDRLIGLAGRSAYSDRDITEDQANEAMAAARQTWRLIRRAISPGRRVLAWFWVERPALLRWA